MRSSRGPPRSWLTVAVALPCTRRVVADADGFGYPVSGRLRSFRPRFTAVFGFSRNARAFESTARVNLAPEPGPVASIARLLARATRHSAPRRTSSSKAAPNRTPFKFYDFRWVFSSVKFTRNTCRANFGFFCRYKCSQGERAAKNPAITPAIRPRRRRRGGGRYDRPTILLPNAVENGHRFQH